jgi:uncharacterized membrane protein
MAAGFRITRFAAALALTGVLALASCGRQQQNAPESVAPPSDAEREAQVAAEQLAALGGGANSAQRALFEGEFEASGGLDSLGSAEGAWDLTLLENYAQFSRPGLGEDGGPTGARDYHARGMRVAAGQLTITIRLEPCTVSGVELPYVAHVLFEGVAYEGCARRGVEEGSRRTWATVIDELLPAIDACLARTGPGARVTFASDLNDGDVSVRLRESNGTRRVCTAPKVGGGAQLQPLSDLDTEHGEGDPEFVRAAAEPRRQNCRAAEPAMGASGEQIGWLVRHTC